MEEKKVYEDYLTVEIGLTSLKRRELALALKYLLNRIFISFFQVSVVVDDVFAEHAHVAGSFSMLGSSRAHVGGSINTRTLPGSRVHANFVGCLKKVRFNILEEYL